MPGHHAKRTTKRITIGSNVAFELGGSTVVGMVIEDRGPLGPAGMRLYRVRARLDDLIEPLEVDVREDRLSVVLDTAV